MKFKYPIGSTPIDSDELKGLIPKHITTQEELNAWESENILQAELWASKLRRKDIVSIINELKNQLLTQIQNLPSEQREHAKQQIESMSPQALETMLQQQQSSSDKNIFRLIVDKEVDSVIVAETLNSIAVLDINPISEGHTIIIPKNPIPLSIISLFILLISSFLL